MGEEEVVRPGVAQSLSGQEPDDALTPRLAAFARAVLWHLWEGCDLDGGDIQALALKHKLIRRVAFDPKKHTDTMGVGVYPGDDWYVENPAIRRLAKAAPADEPRSGSATPDGSPSPGMPKND